MGDEKKLVKTRMMENYNGVILDCIDRHTLVPVSDKEIRQHKEEGGLINYILHHWVENDGSTTTHLWLVANSATQNFNTGLAVNDLWSRGPNSLLSLLRVTLRCRCYSMAVVWDLSKAYHSISTSRRERFLRLIVWRFDRRVMEDLWT